MRENRKIFYGAHWHFFDLLTFDFLKVILWKNLDLIISLLNLYSIDREINRKKKNPEVLTNRDTVKSDNTWNRHHRLNPHTTEHRDEDKHVCNGVNLILHLASITVALTHAGGNKGRSIPKWLIPLKFVPYLPLSVSVDSKPFCGFFFPLTLAQAKTLHMWCAMWEILRPFPLYWRAACRDRLWCWNAPQSLTIPICFGMAMVEGGNDGEMERRRDGERGKKAEWWSGH